MAQFGVTCAVTAIFLSVFMAGLGLGAWLAGKWLSHRPGMGTISPVILYAASEFIIGILAIFIPYELRWGHELLLRVGADAGWTSFRYTLLSGVWLAFCVIPASAGMGATFPFAMSALSRSGQDQNRSFSYLYLANLLGAMVGVTLPLLLIEKFGFAETLRIGSLVNVGIAACALVASRFWELPHSSFYESRKTGLEKALPGGTRTNRWYLFAIGVSSMGMEIVWVRLFTPYLGTVIYAFAGILGIYLVAAFLGGKAYRKGWLAAEGNWNWFALGASGFLPLVAADPTLTIPRLLRLPLGIFLPAMVAGFTTPMLVDEDSAGDGSVAASAYAMNALGCIVGPLLAGFVLLPYLGERWTLLALASPWFLVGSLIKGSAAFPGIARERRRAVAIVLFVGGCAVAILCQGYEGRFPVHRVLRDSTATVIAAGESRQQKRLLVNGYGMSELTPVTKMMAHLPLAFANSPRKILIVCFGMGTTHRSALSWGIEVTSVELTPSVPKLFSYFHADAEALMSSSHSRVEIDDGRRFLERSPETYDVITVDPPPPVEAAGSSLLYSKEFYEIAKKRLNPGGILEQWIPGGDDATVAAETRALDESFPHVRAFASVEGFGIHFLASGARFPYRTASQLAARLPSPAVSDILEWGPATTVEEQFELMLSREISVASLLALDPRGKALSDDNPVNEYFRMRRLTARR
jgi:spermidine synthase/MFS family permease